MTEKQGGDTHASVSDLDRPEVLDLAGLYEAHARQVWRTLVRLGVQPVAIEDAVQDVFLIAHEGLSRFEARSRPATWLIGIAVRVAANLRRSVKRRAGLSLATLQPDVGVDPEVHLAQQRALRDLERVLGTLPDEQREVIVLVDLEGLSAPEAASAIEVKLNTVYSRLRLGRAALARALVRPTENVS